MALPARNIPFANLPLGRAVSGLRLVGNLPGSGVLVLPLGRALIDRGFFSFALTSAHSLAAFVLSSPLRSRSRKLRMGWGLGSRDTGGGVVGCATLGCTGWVGRWVVMGGRGWICRSSPLTENPGLRYVWRPCTLIGSSP